MSTNKFEGDQRGAERRRLGPRHLLLNNRPRTAPHCHDPPGCLTHPFSYSPPRLPPTPSPTTSCWSSLRSTSRTTGEHYHTTIKQRAHVGEGHCSQQLLVDCCITTHHIYILPINAFKYLHGSSCLPRSSRPSTSSVSKLLHDNQMMGETIRKNNNSFSCHSCIVLRQMIFKECSL